MNFQVFMPFIIYFVVLILIGIYSTNNSSKGISEFFLGGRKMNRFVVALSAAASGRISFFITIIVSYFIKGKGEVIPQKSPTE